MLSHCNKYVEKPVEYNRKINNFRATSGSHGCVSTRACEGCGLLVSDSICLCINAFDCPKCGYKQRVKYDGPGIIIPPGQGIRLPFFHYQEPLADGAGI